MGGRTTLLTTLRCLQRTRAQMQHGSGSEGEQGKQVLLAMSPLLDEEQMDAATHSDFIKATLEIFGKTVENLQFLIGDNENTNEAVADLLRVPFIGGASHRMNLAVNDYLNPFEPLLEKIHGLKKKL